MVRRHKSQHTYTAISGLVLGVLGTLGVAGSLTPTDTAQAADMIIEQDMEIAGIPGQPPMTTTQKIWVKPEKMRMEMRGGTGMPGMGNMTTIIRGDLKKIIMLDEKSKTYMEMPSDFAGGITDGMEIKCDVQSTGNTKKIKDWNCQEYVITTSGGPADSKVTIWVTEDIEYDDQLRASMLEATAKNPMLKPLIEKLRKLKGFPVEQSIEIDMGGMKMTTATRLKSVTRETIADDMFETPEDFTRREMPH